MSEATNQEIFRAIGGLTEAVEGLRRDVEKFDMRNEGAQARADEHRAVIHEEVAQLTTRMKSAEATLADVKTVTDEVKQWKQRGIGALAFAGFAGTALGGGIVWVLAKVFRLDV